MATGKLYVFFDESGTHALQVPNEDNSLFCLAACLSTSDEYQLLKEQIKDFKQKYLGLAYVPLHLYNIRAKDGPFKFLRNPEIRRDFNADLKSTLSAIKTTIIACVIDKDALFKAYGKGSWNPYHYALECILERVLLEVKNKPTTMIHCIAEKRGRKEDNKFKAKFEEITNYGTSHVNILAMQSKVWDLDIVRKDACEPGLELADLVAAPIRNCCAGKQDPLWEIIVTKFRRSHLGKVEGWGLIKKP